MTTYTLTQAQLLWLMNSARADSANNNNAELIKSLKPNLQEPVGYQYQDREGNWCNFMNEKHLADTRADGSWPIRVIYTHPAPMSKEAMVKVLAALESNRVMGRDGKSTYTIEITPKTTLEAIAIMKSAIEGVK